MPAWISNIFWLVPVLIPGKKCGWLTQEEALKPENPPIARLHDCSGWFGDAPPATRYDVPSSGGRTRTRPASTVIMAPRVSSSP